MCAYVDALQVQLNLLIPDLLGHRDRMSGFSSANVIYNGDNHGTNGAHHAHDNTVHARLSFYLDPSQGGQSEFAIGTAGAYRRKFDERQIQIQDARGHESDFSLDTHGFQYCKRASTETDFTDDGQIETVAYPEVQQLLEDVTGATSVYIFSHITRRDDSAKIQAALATDPKLSSASTPVPGIFPARYIHIDQTPACALQVLQDHFDASSPVGRHALEKNGRWGIINGWRPSRVSSIR
ncbi:hypothetical protein LTR09_011590 [Extremus antarcticus]|uniref:Uncharacterized protein n=1 Tax=Extremus antarcticus TaxID=702011 RepID=A0AAJ0G7I0_9PEZI|nr:hypothetical protein LTR09_011590 [Extremus antarcticus]